MLCQQCLQLPIVLRHLLLAMTGHVVVTVKTVGQEGKEPHSASVARQPDGKARCKIGTALLDFDFTISRQDAGKDCANNETVNAKDTRNDDRNVTHQPFAGHGIRSCHGRSRGRAKAGKGDGKCRAEPS